MIMRGNLQSSVEVKESFFYENNTDSIVTSEITESHGILVFSICEYDDKTGNAIFDDYKDSLCRNSGEKLHWSLLQEESRFSNDLIVLTFRSSHWDPPNNKAHHGMKFQFTISSKNLDQPLPVPAVQGVQVKMQFTEPLDKPRSRLGVGMLIYTNSSIQPGQRFLQTDSINFGVELEAGNFLSTSVQFDKRDPPQPGAVNTSPAYLFWRAVCFVDPVDRWSSGRHVASFQSNPPHTHKDNERINRSLPQVIYGPRRFNIHIHDNDTIATMEEWFGFGSSSDGFYAKTNYVDWTFVMALGHSPSDFTPQTFRLFGPLILPLTVLVVSIAYFYGRQRWGAPLTADSTDATQPLIDEIIDEDDVVSGYPGFRGPHIEEYEEGNNGPSASSYGTI
ncbi:hypothetical protein Aperf_G00000083236 [Anoplocephala perfoliata]